MSSLGWCDTCNVPILDGLSCGLCHHKSRPMSFTKTELKPIFAEETDLYRQILARNEVPDMLAHSNLSFYNIMGEIVIDGQKVFRLSFDKATQNFIPKFFKKFENTLPTFHGSSRSMAIAANEYILQKKEKEAIDFLKQTALRFQHLPLAVSFSGGKDSTVALALTKLAANNFDAIFLNTTVEFDETVNYVRDISKTWNIPLIETNPPHNFFSLCEELGPPSTRMKWCCKTQKFSPQNQLINEQYSDGVLVISGIRKIESNIRSRFNRIQKNKMIPKQVLAFPILNWTSLDIWLYLMWKNIPHNKMYDYGFSRIGCWACPEKSLRDFKLVETIRPELSGRLRRMLEKYAENNSIDNPEYWITYGDWRHRKTKWTRTTVCQSSRPCTLDDEMIYDFKIGPYVDRVKEFLKIFGKTKIRGPVMRVCGPDMEITFIGNKMRTKIKNPTILPVFEKQLSRALNCVGCGACVGICSSGALKIETGELKISDKCVGCLKCVTSNGIRMSCVSVNYNPHILSVA